MKHIAFGFCVFVGLVLSYAEDSPNIVIVPGGKNGDGTTTRYWDCCKPSCAWQGNHDPPLASCLADGVTKADANIESGCVGGSTYVCNNQGPWVVNSTLAYGFVAASFTGKPDVSFCCGCLLFSFKDQITNKKMVAQVTNTGNGDVVNAFDFAIPGAGVGYYNEGCSNQWGAPVNGWGDQYGGVNSAEECNQLPQPLQESCKFRFGWMEGASNPKVSFVQVQCPAEIVARSGCNIS